MCKGVSILWEVSWDQATKCTWRMPWLSEAMKDVVSCDKLR